MGNFNPSRIVLAFLITFAIALVVNFFKPLPTIIPKVEAYPDLPATAIDLPWPGYGQGAVGAIGYGLLATNNPQEPVPIASIAKVITALAVLKQKPLAPDEQGPTITISQQDVDSYNTYYSADGSVAKVQLGETISEYQALEAMLLPSANNMADTLANWAFGSMDNYLSYANKMVKTIGLSQTAVSGASGFSDQTLSTASDLVNLGFAALSDPVLAQIASEQQATIPVAGTVDNVNWLLGKDGVIGIKTGNTDQAGGCYLFAAKESLATTDDTIVVGALLGAPDLNTAISDSRSLLAKVPANFESDTAVSKGQTVLGYYETPWGSRVAAKAGKTLSIMRWKGSAVTMKISLSKITSARSTGQNVGTVTISSGGKSVSGPAILDGNIKPPFAWRLFRN